MQGVSAFSKEVFDWLLSSPGPVRIEEPEGEGEGRLLLLEVPVGGKGLEH